MNVVPSIPRVLTALAEWGACLVYIQRYEKRLKGWRLWSVLGLFLVIQSLFLYVTGSWPVALWIPCMVVAVGMMFGCIALCCNMSLISVGYCTVRAFLLAEFAASLEWQLYAYGALRLGKDSFVYSAAFAAVVYGAVFLVMYRLESRPSVQYPALSVRPRELWPALVMGLTCFAMSNLSFVYANTPFSGSYISDVYNIRTLVDLAGVVMLYAYHIQRSELRVQYELDAVKNILQNQYVQYRQSRESIDLINRKYHDLKHQIAVLRAEPDAQKRADFLDGMEQEIRNYEAQNKTGNSVLDTVLTGKSLYCAKHKIELTCVADGAQLGFMDVMDICTVFGNMLDNAIECELRIPDKEKRLIHVAVYAKKDFLIIHCENYCPEEVAFRDGLPVTTKQDANYHGYGVKSIRYTAQKYGGSVTMEVRDKWFVMNVLIPIPQKED